MKYDGRWRKDGSLQSIETEHDIIKNAESLGNVSISIDGNLINLTKITYDYVLKPKQTMSFVFKIKELKDVHVGHQIDYIDYKSIKIFVQYQSGSLSKSYTDQIQVED